MLKKEELKNYITGELEQIGCKNINFSNGETGLLVVSFDCDNLISFRKEIEGWNYTGIQLNLDKKESTDGKYKIEFRKIV